MAEILQFPNKGVLIEGVEELAKVANDRNTYSNNNYQASAGVAKVYDIQNYMSEKATSTTPYKSISGATLSDTELFRSDTLGMTNLGDKLDSNVQQTNNVSVQWAQQTKLSADGSKVEIIDKVDQYTNDTLDTYANTQPTIVGTVAGGLASGLALVSLGKTIAGAVYDANPDLWNSFGWEAMDPDTWEANLIEAPDGRPTFKDLAVMTLLQLDYQGKTASQYISEDIFAFITRGLAKMGLLNTDDVQPTPAPEGATGVTKDPDSVTEGVSKNGKYVFYKLFKSLYVYSIPARTSTIFRFVEDAAAEKQTGYGVQVFNNNETDPVYVTLYKNPSSGNLAMSAFYENGNATPTLLRFQSGKLTDGVWSWGTKLFGSTSSNDSTYWPNNTPTWTNYSYVPYGAMSSYISASTFNPDGLTANCNVSELSDTGAEHVKNWAETYANSNWMLNMMWNMLGSAEKAEPTSGVGEQTGATQLTSAEVAALTASDTDNAGALQILKGRYSDLWKYRLETTTVQPDGTTKTTTWLKVGVPNDIDANGNPIINQDSAKGTAGSLQTAPEITFDPAQLNPNTTVDPAASTSPSVLNSLLNSFRPNASTQSDPEGEAVPAPDPAEDYTEPTDVNPGKTGIGVTPGVVIPDGSAGDLFTVYRPTATQLAALGSWLWSDDFIDQLKKMFSDPMQSIIGLHKVFIPPLLGGSSTIKVGYLDSGVPSDVIRQQYSTVNCGSVDLPEYFGNVFDYAPHTRVQLYLPFVGIVDLDPADVMRSTITVKYIGDAYSGSCLANVYVKRDGNECCLYTFTGNDAVQYPLSSGSYMGLASAVLGVAGGIATAMVNPIYGATAMIGGVMSARTKVQHAGNLSGNAGAMGIKYPYLIITRPQTATATNFQNFVGKPANVLAQVSQCSGYTRIEGCQVSNINEATQEEKEEITKLLSSGFLA